MTLLAVYGVGGGAECRHREWQPTVYLVTDPVDQSIWRLRRANHGAPTIEGKTRAEEGIKTQELKRTGTALRTRNDDEQGALALIPVCADEPTLLSMLGSWRCRGPPDCSSLTLDVCVSLRGSCG